MASGVEAQRLVDDRAEFLAKPRRCCRRTPDSTWRAPQELDPYAQVRNLKKIGKNIIKYKRRRADNGYKGQAMRDRPQCRQLGRKGRCEIDCDLHGLVVKNTIRLVQQRDHRHKLCGDGV